MPWIVYETRCTVSGKIYIGVHKQDGDEFDGYLGSGKVLGNAIAKHGRENFERRTLFAFESSEEAFAREAEIVTEEFCRNKSNYNSRPGGLGGSSGAAREGLSRKWQDPEYRAKMAESNRRKWQGPESMAKMAESNRRKWQDPEYRAKMAEANRRKWKDPEYRARMAESNRRKWQDPESMAKIAESNRRKWQDPEYRAKMAEANRRKWKDPEYRARIAEANRRKWQDPEYRAKASQAMKVAASKRRAAKQFKSIAEGTPARTDPCLGSSM